MQVWVGSWCPSGVGSLHLDLAGWALGLGASLSKDHGGYSTLRACSSESRHFRGLCVSGSPRDLKLQAGESAFWVGGCHPPPPPGPDDRHAPTPQQKDHAPRTQARRDGERTEETMRSDATETPGQPDFLTNRKFIGRGGDGVGAQPHTLRGGSPGAQRLLGARKDATGLGPPAVSRGR